MLQHAVFSRTVLLVALSLSACDDTAQGVQEDASEVVSKVEISAAEAEAEVAAELREFRQKSQQSLRELDVKLERLEESTADATDEAKLRTQQELQELQRDRSALAHDIKQIRAKTATEWQETKREVDQSMARLGKKINQALDSAGDHAEATMR